MALPTNTGFTGISYETFTPLTIETGFTGFSFELAPIEKIKLDDSILQKGTFIDINSTRIEKDSVVLANSETIIAKNVGANSIEYDYTIPVARPVAPYTVFANVTYSTIAGGTTTKDIEITVN